MKGGYFLSILLKNRRFYHLKKVILVTLMLILTLVGCSSTFPAIKKAWLNGLIAASSESKTIVQMDVEVPEELMEDLGEYGQMILDLFKAGIVIEQKTTKENNYYLKIGFVDSKPIKESEYWKSDREPYIEVFMKDNDFYARTSSEDQLIQVGDSYSEFTREFYSSNLITNEERADLKEFFVGEMQKYLQQFDFKIRKIEDKGFTSYTTPEGTQMVKQIQVELTIDDMLAFATYLLGNLAEYDGLKPLFMEFERKVMKNQVEPTPEEELDKAIAEFREILLEAKSTLEEYDEKALEDELGIDIEFLIQNDMYITTEAETIGNKAVLDLIIAEPSTGDFAKIKLTVDTQRWNVNKEVSLPDTDFKNSLSLKDLGDRQKIQELGEQSIVRSYAEEKLRRKGRLTIGKEYAQVKNNYVSLEAAPYINESGNTMVPLSIISAIVESEAIWNGETKEVTFNVDENEVIVKIGSNLALVNGEQFEMPEAAIILNGRTFVPLRFVTENLGASVIWNEEQQSIYIEFE